ncbi:hypothetical protein LCGC14_2668190 [marine sediment metagenome]|uniref:Uncharacterized protein n=1 Tax=marine sediment metagenome TaxID=412755 RepID=A0A0F8ZQ02_9ZZZZ
MDLIKELKDFKEENKILLQIRKEHKRIIELGEAKIEILEELSVLKDELIKATIDENPAW